jgi:4-aminobutyrate aminotransferase-like enzyme
MQARGGIRIPAPSFLRRLRTLCDEHEALLIADEVYTGFARTGKWFACEHSGVTPDLICLGKALTGGFPLSACVGRGEVMDAAWPRSTGEAIHTSTFLGHPVGCAMALAQIEEIRKKRLVERAAKLGRSLLEGLSALLAEHPTPGDRRGKISITARGAGLMAGLELQLGHGAPATALALEVIKRMLRRGLLLLPEGAHSNVISFTPPLTIPKGQLLGAVEVLGVVLGQCRQHS